MSDLYGLFLFARVHPFAERGWWTHAVARPLAADGMLATPPPDALAPALRCMPRCTKPGVVTSCATGSMAAASGCSHGLQHQSPSVVWAAAAAATVGSMPSLAFASGLQRLLAALGGDGGGGALPLFWRASKQDRRIQSQLGVPPQVAGGVSVCIHAGRRGLG